jgi:hypothetical protein
MKIENKMNYQYVKEALIRWVLGTDGQDGATCELIGVIPWGKELESVISWNKVCDDINDSFGGRTDEKGKLWDVGIILTNKNEFDRFNRFITLKANNVVSVYQSIIDRANSLCNTKFEIIVYRFIGVVDNVAKYEPIYHYFGNNLTSLANNVYDKLKVSDWKNDDFIDSVHYGFYNNCFTAFKSNYINFVNETHLQLEVKKNS